MGSTHYEEKAAPRANGEAAKNKNNKRFNLTTGKTAPQAPPLTADITGLAVALGSIAGRVEPEIWHFLRNLRQNLLACAERAEALENSLCLPEGE